MPLIRATIAVPACRSYAPQRSCLDCKRWNIVTSGRLQAIPYALKLDTISFSRCSDSWTTLIATTCAGLSHPEGYVSCIWSLILAAVYFTFRRSAYGSRRKDQAKRGGKVWWLRHWQDRCGRLNSVRPEPDLLPQPVTGSNDEG